MERGRRRLLEWACGCIDEKYIMDMLICRVKRGEWKVNVFARGGGNYTQVM